MKRWGVVIILVLSFCGVADSTYIAQHEASGTPLLCNIQNLSGCNTVLASQYSHIFGISIAELGTLFYSILFVVAALELVLFDRMLRRVLQGAAIVGALFSLYFAMVQIFLIGALCIYCLTSTVIAIIILILASFIEPLRKSVVQIVAPLPAPSPAPYSPGGNSLPMPPTA